MKNSLPRLLVAQSVLDTITQETLRYPSVETGGILIGRAIHGQDGGKTILLTAATGPGPGACHHSGEFAPNVTYQQEILDCYVRCFQASYLGSWHKHPAHFSRPSTGDLLQAKEILADPDYQLTELVIPIVTVKAGEIIFSPYYLDGQLPTFVRLEWDVEPDTSPLVQEIRGRVWFDTASGRARIQKDRESLLNNGAVEVKSFDIDGHFCYYVRTALTMRCPGGGVCREIVFACGHDYPCTSPKVYLLSGDDQYPAKVKGLRHWTPRHLLGELAADLLLTDETGEVPVTVAAPGDTGESQCG